MKTSSANALLAVLIGLSAAPSAFAQDDRPAILRDLGFDQHLGEALPLDARFVDASGQAVRLGDYFGEKPIVVALVYYECPMLCTLTLNGLESAMSVLRFDVGDQYDVVTVSFEPRETPELARAKKAAYVERYGRAGAAEGWHFLTGDAEQIGRLTDALGFRYAWDEETQQYAHPSGIVIVTPDGKIARYLYGIEYAPKDLRLGLVEASEGKIGSPVDAFLLFCYQYDPKTGRYGAAVVNLLRGSAVLTLLVLISFWFAMWRRERMTQVAGLAQERRA